MGEDKKFHKSPSQIAKNVYDPDKKVINIGLENYRDTASQTELISALSMTNELLVKIELHLREITKLTGL